MIYARKTSSYKKDITIYENGNSHRYNRPAEFKITNDNPVTVNATGTGYILISRKCAINWPKTLDLYYKTFHP